jgi:hypothetical protein
MFLFVTWPSLGAMITIRSFVKAAGVALVAAGLVGSLLAPSVEAAESKTEDVVGGWLGELPCPFTSVAPSAGSATTVAFVCVSGTTWDGSWVGHTVYRVAGTLDVASGDIHATIDETLNGLVSATRAAGTLHLVGTVDVDGATGAIVVRERIVGGTGAFEGSSGTVEFDGAQVALVVGHGGYQGTWAHP